MPAFFQLAVALAALALISAHPLPNVSHLADAFERNTSLACNDIYHCRTMWGIVQGCATTVFLCTWVSYHPDLPNPRHTEMRVAFVRLATVCLSIILPEILVVKAAKQWREVQKFNSESLFEGA